MSAPISFKHLLEHRPKREGLYKFLLLLAVLIGYFGYLSWEYDLKTGGTVAALTWSFFVLCTPVADAGFLLDFPVRLITGMRMFVTELLVWAIAVGINVFTVLLDPDAYSTTFLTSLFYKILTHPWPYWSIILLCAVGTFLSVKFGDEMMDAVAQRDRHFFHRHGFLHKVILMVVLFVVILWAYYHLIDTLGVKLPV